MALKDALYGEVVYRIGAFYGCDGDESCVERASAAAEGKRIHPGFELGVGLAEGTLARQAMAAERKDERE